MDLRLKGAATLIRLPMLAAELERLKPNTHVHVHIDDLDYIDHACIDLLSNWDRQHRTTGGSLEIEWDGLTEKYKKRSGLRARAEATGRLATLRICIEAVRGALTRAALAARPLPRGER